VTDETQRAEPSASVVVSDRPVRIGMVAGEASGDILGSGLIKALKARYPNAEFTGIGGPLMIKEGFKSFVPMERLSVMGLVEVLGRIFELIGIRRRIKKHFIQNPPDAFVGIDAPDFNLGLEEKLKRAQIKTSHYVSPSVWAWRQKRVFKIARAVDLMLTLLPFEARFYRDHNVKVKFVGHPLADIIPVKPDVIKARAHLGFGNEQKLIAILPGSRGGEIKYIAHSLLMAARELHTQLPDYQFLHVRRNSWSEIDRPDCWICRKLPRKSAGYCTRNSRFSYAVKQVGSQLPIFSVWRLSLS